MRELNLSEIEAVSGGDFNTPDPIVPNPQSDLGRVANDAQTILYNGFTSVYEAADMAAQYAAQKAAEARAAAEAQARAMAEAMQRMLR